MTNGRTKSELFLLFCTLIWGTTFVIVKNSLDGASPFILIVVRFGIAAILFLPFCFSALVKIDKNTIVRGSILGLLLFAGFATQTIGLQYTSASKSGFITGMLVVFTPIFQLLIERRPPKLGNVIGVILVTPGLYLLTSPKGAELNRGDALTLVCAALFAVYVVYLDMLTQEHDISQLTFLQMAVTAILAAICVMLIEERRVEFTFQLVLALAYLSVMATLLTLYIQTRYQRQTSPTRAAIIFSLEPVFSALFAYFIGNEVIGGRGVLGGGLIVAGLMVSELSDVIFQSPQISFK